MSTEPRSERAAAPVVLARVAADGAIPVRDAVDAAVAAGAAMVELDLMAFEAAGPPIGAPVVVVVTSLTEAERAIALGAAALRIESTGPERDGVAALAVEHDLALHVPFGRGAPSTAVLDVGALDGDAGDDLVGRLAALADLSAAGRTVIATIGPVGPDDTAALAALATDRGAAVLRVHDVAAAVRASRVLAAIAAEHGVRAR